MIENTFAKNNTSIGSSGLRVSCLPVFITLFMWIQHSTEPANFVLVTPFCNLGLDLKLHIIAGKCLHRMLSGYLAGERGER